MPPLARPFSRLVAFFRRMEPATPRDQSRHTLFEDLYALLIGAALLSVGLIMLRQEGLVTGGVAGIALLISYLVPVPVSVLFLLVNLPFFLLAPKVMGWRFAIKTVAVIVLVMLGGLLVPHLIEIARINRVFAAVFAGSMIGLGVLSLARHAAGVGGAGIVALWAQKAKGWSAGRILLMVDSVVLLISLPVLDTRSFLLSVLSAVAINGVLITNHRPGRYTGH